MDHQDAYSADNCMFNLSLTQSVIPTCFKQTTIVPVPKNGKLSK